jgi:hypothetical protein
MTRVGLCVLVGALVLAACGDDAVEPMDSDDAEADGGHLRQVVKRVLPDGAVVEVEVEGDAGQLPHDDGGSDAGDVMQAKDASVVRCPALSG